MWVTRQLHSRSVSLFSPSLWNASWWADWLQQVHADLILVLDEESPQIVKESGKWLHVGDECISWLKLRWIHEKWLFDSVLLTPNNNNLFCRESSVKTVEEDVNVTRQNSCFSLHTRSQSIVNSSPLSGNRTSTIVSAPVCCLDPGVWLNCIKLTTRSRSRRSLTRASLQACSSHCGGHNTCSSSLCSSSWSAEMKRSYPRWRGINSTEKGNFF